MRQGILHHSCYIRYVLVTLGGKQIHHSKHGSTPLVIPHVVIQYNVILGALLALLNTRTFFTSYLLPLPSSLLPIPLPFSYSMERAQRPKRPINSKYFIPLQGLSSSRARII